MKTPKDYLPNKIKLLKEVRYKGCLITILVEYNDFEAITNIPETLEKVFLSMLEWGK